MKQVGQEGYTYLGIIELDKIKEAEMKEKITKEYKRRQRLILKSKLNGRNKVTTINTSTVPIFRYRTGIIQWKASELKDLDRKSRKTITMYGGLHQKSDVDRLHVKKEGGRGLISVEQGIREEENSLWFYVANPEEDLIRGVSAAETINTRETIMNVEFNKQKSKELKEKWSEKQMQRQFIRETMEEVDKEKTWQWLSRGDLKIVNDKLDLKHYVEKKVKVCNTIISGCEKLADKEYKRRHNNVAKNVHRDICKKNELEHSEKWYEHAPEGAVENQEIKALWIIHIQCDNLIEARQSDIIVIDTKEQKGIIIDIAVPADVGVEKKEKEKVESTRI